MYAPLCRQAGHSVVRFCKGLSSTKQPLRSTGLSLLNVGILEQGVMVLYHPAAGTREAVLCGWVEGPSGTPRAWRQDASSLASVVIGLEFRALAPWSWSPRGPRVGAKAVPGTFDPGYAFSTRVESAKPRKISKSKRSKKSRAENHGGDHSAQADLVKVTRKHTFRKGSYSWMNLPIRQIAG